MSSDLLNALITVGGIIISSVISYAISRSTANKEIVKLQLTWQREDVVSSDEEFSAMAAAVAKHLHNPTGASKSAAMQQVTSIRTKENGTLGEMLDKLYADIYHDLIGNIDPQLSKVINQKREAKRKSNTANCNNP